MRYENIAKFSDIQQACFKYQLNNGEKCVFISHKQEDKEAAQAIGEFLLNTVGVNIYLDSMDKLLQSATQLENDKLIVESIKKGLEYSTHLLCLISEQTRLSWWVPYEIGIADSKKLSISSLKLKNVQDIPSFLKIHPSFYNLSDFIGSTTEYKLFKNSQYRQYNTAYTSNLEKYIDI